MKVSDIVLLAVNNLKRNTMHTILTTLGVAVGIGSLASMISFGQGISGNVAKSMETNDVFTGLTVTSRDIDFQSSTNRDGGISERKIVPLSDSVISEFQSWDEVAMVFPEITKPATIKFHGVQLQTKIKAVPAAMVQFSPFDNITMGRFFKDDNEPYVVVSKNFLEQMNIFVGSEESGSDKPHHQKMPLDSIIGQEIEIVTKVFDVDKVMNLSGNSNNNKLLPIKNESTYLKIAGIVESNSFTTGIFSSGVFVPSKTINYIPCIDLQNVYDIIDGMEGKFGKYNSVHIRVKDHKNLKTVINRVEQIGFNVFSIGDKLDDIERIFLMLDSVLAAIGTIALMVSVLGILNTLIMAIYERRKEIGVMKSLGATQIQIKLIFYFEAAIIGFMGGVFGVLGGKIASQAASSVANNQIGGIINCDIEYFDFSWVLIFSSILFSTIISILASIYPADKASRIDPLDALRRE